MTCPICHDEQWVCEDHPDKPWLGGCCGGAGMPCTCSPMHHNYLTKQAADAAMKRISKTINRSAAQHLHHIRKAFFVLEKVCTGSGPIEASQCKSVPRVGLARQAK